MIGRVLSHITTKLGDFDLIFQLTLETGKENLSLAWLKTIAQTGNGTCAICYTELDKLLVHEVFVPEHFDGVIHIVMN